MQVKFANGKTVEAVNILGGSRYFQSASRNIMEIQVAKSEITFEELESLTGDATNTAKITIIDGDEQYLHEDYTLRMEIGVKAVETAKETVDSPAATEERICVVLAQKTYIEKQLELLRAAIKGA